MPYHIQLDERLQTLQFRPLPRGLEEARTTILRQLRAALRAARREQELDAKPNLVVEAQRYADILDRNPELTKSRVAAELGVSRIRVYQMLSILRLPHPILDFILAHDTPDGRAVFTERRLRPLTQASSVDEQLALFGQLVVGASLPPAFERHGYPCSRASVDALHCVAYIGAMKTLKQTRERRGVSQRRLAGQAGVSFRALQMIEAGETDARLSSLMKIAAALGTPGAVVQTELDRLIAEDPDSVVAISRKINADGEASWKLWLFEFVDAFRRSPREDLVTAPPTPETSARVRSLLASTVETLCAERGLPRPWWCAGVDVLPTPWFVAGVENLKALALVESPTHFRKRDIFVLANFLSRA